MKKTIALLLGLLVLLGLAACSDGSAARKTGGTTAPTVQDILDNAGSSEGATARIAQTVSSGAPTPEPDLPALTGDTIDLTAMDSNMVYSQVYQMMTTPQDYVGKTVIMEGVFDVLEAPTRNYYACIIADATACCSQGIEFELAQPLAYPQEYPELYSSIKVTGTFETYLEDGQLYCQLGGASFC